MNHTMQEKVALVTGGATGIGAACVRSLASAGAQVMASDIDSDAVEAMAATCRADGLDVSAMAHDVCDEGQWEDVIASTVAALGGLDVLVNNAGAYTGGLLESNDLQQLRRVNEVNVESVFLGMKHAVLAMKPGGTAGNGGSIINLSSVAGCVGVPGHAAYGATKGAVRLITKHAAVECGSLGYGIRVNSVHPGLIDTDMGAKVFQDFVDIGLAPNVEEAKTIVLGMTALGRLGTVDDVAGVVAFLASEAAAYVTGAEFMVDGGLTAK